MTPALCACGCGKPVLISTKTGKPNRHLRGHYANRKGRSVGGAKPRSFTPDPPRLCECGCGAETGFSRKTDSVHGLRRGQRFRFLPGHHRKLAARLNWSWTVDETTGCWLWQGTVNRDGYAIGTQEGRRVLVHRFLWEQRHGPMPSGLVSDHLCHVRRCVNPAHIEPVSRFENARRGDRTRITLTQIEEIRELSEHTPVSRIGEIADAYGVSPRTVLGYVLRERGVTRP